VGLALAQQGETPPADPGSSDLKAGVPAAEAARKNPVEADAASLDRGKKLFVDRCADCHGTNGKGKGDLAVRLHYKVPDLTKPDALKERTDGELFYVVTKGCGGMPGEQDYIDDRDKWDLVNYCRSIGPKG
jgi:mono/diheme cytochrome c family protein